MIGYRKIQITPVLPPTDQDLIIEVVLNTLGITMQDIREKNRTAPMPDYRKTLAFCLKKYCHRWSTSINLADVFRMTHASLLTMITQAVSLQDSDKSFRATLAECCLKIEMEKEVRDKSIDKSAEEMINDLVENKLVTKTYADNLLSKIK